MREFAKEFYHSLAWIKTRDYVLKRDLHLCQECLKKGKLTPAKAVHHIIHLSPENIGDPHISLDPNNLESVCQDCHAELHREYRGDERFYIDEFGEIQITNDESR